MRTAFLLALFLVAPAVWADEEKPTPQQVFEKRILPIFKSSNPSSCVQCHLAGVDLKNYILPSHDKTLLSLRDQGLIDLRPLLVQSQLLPHPKRKPFSCSMGAAQRHDD